jgi:hypothetical protein
MCEIRKETKSIENIALHDELFDPSPLFARDGLGGSACIIPTVMMAVT